MMLSVVKRQTCQRKTSHHHCFQSLVRPEDQQPIPEGKKRMNEKGREEERRVNVVPLPPDITIKKIKQIRGEFSYAMPSSTLR